MTKVNLLEETLQKIQWHGYKIDDIHWIGLNTGDATLSWQEFKLLANVEYKNNACFLVNRDARNKILSNLVIVFNDRNWLFRDFYDGSLCWEFARIPELKESPQTLLQIFANS